MENIFCINFYKNLFILKKKVWRKLKILHIFLVLANFVTREKPRIYDICNVILILKTFQKNWSLVLNVFKFKYSFSEKKWIHLDDFSVSSSEFQRVIFYINRSANVENHLKFRPTLNVKQLLNWWSISKETSFFSRHILNFMHVQKIDEYSQFQTMIRSIIFERSISNMHYSLIK